ncbi:aminotransferase class I/II-fold pyridoxal phosphate-dependent enzyme, partial [Klebsiella pneumoniae]
GPGDTAIVPAPSFPIHVYAVALASGNVISLDCTQPDRFLSSVANVAEHLNPKPKLVILNFPHNPSTTVVEQDFFVEVVKLA